MKYEQLLEEAAKLVITCNIDNYAEQVDMDNKTPEREEFNEFGTVAETAKTVLGDHFFYDVAEKVAELQKIDPKYFNQVVQLVDSWKK